MNINIPMRACENALSYRLPRPGLANISVRVCFLAKRHIKQPIDAPKHTKTSEAQGLCAPPLCVVYFLQHGDGLNRPSHIPKHAPLTPHAHPTHLFPGADKKLHDKATLLSVFQKCEEAVLNATDDCSDDAAGCRRTLELAKEIVEGMLGHARLEEVCLRGGRSLQLFFFVAACRGRLMPCHALPSPASAIGMGVRATDDATGWMYFCVLMYARETCFFVCFCSFGG